ncbi:hypothetical protein SAMN05216223_11222 [Actinacidiphila yanglinensis]|uniref:Uncharacterized protein n=1 Tax=Actinacidiphila yanglinensis TaxID=310779 RepID=A0A1H6D4U3_9ACTN|nr:hypothetical protein [Actinacidiphila yanglinensis]SEG80389.1 hypothetical protein SAMN05216223_11222 [Actinacidiphila yanglinensis]
MWILWGLFGVALLCDLAVRVFFVHLVRLSRRGVSGTEIIAEALAPVLRAVLALRLAGIAAAFLLAAGSGGAGSVVVLGVGCLWSAVTVAEIVPLVRGGWRSRHPRG